MGSLVAHCSFNRFELYAQFFMFAEFETVEYPYSSVSTNGQVGAVVDDPWPHTIFTAPYFDHLVVRNSYPMFVEGLCRFCHFFDQFIRFAGFHGQKSLCFFHKLSVSACFTFPVTLPPYTPLLVCLPLHICWLVCFPPPVLHCFHSCSLIVFPMKRLIFSSAVLSAISRVARFRVRLSNSVLYLGSVVLLVVAVSIMLNVTSITPAGFPTLDAVAVSPQPGTVPIVVPNVPALTAAPGHLVEFVSDSVDLPDVFTPDATTSDTTTSDASTFAPDVPASVSSASPSASSGLSASDVVRGVAIATRPDVGPHVNVTRWVSDTITFSRLLPAGYAPAVSGYVDDALAWISATTGLSFVEVDPGSSAQLSITGYGSNGGYVEVVTSSSGVISSASVQIGCCFTRVPFEELGQAMGLLGDRGGSGSIFSQDRMLQSPSSFDTWLLGNLYEAAPGTSPEMFADQLTASLPD